MPAIPLPAGLEEKLDDVAVEVRRLRILRGVSWFAAKLSIIREAVRAFLTRQTFEPLPQPTA